MPFEGAAPKPAEHGNYELLKRYVNLESHAFLLYVGWLTFIINSPKTEATKYLFLVIKGTQGTGKTFASKTTQRVIDPNEVGAQTLPTSPRDLAIMLQRLIKSGDEVPQRLKDYADGQWQRPAVQDWLKLVPKK